jgi:hypothetical protein
MTNEPAMTEELEAFLRELSALAERSIARAAPAESVGAQLIGFGASLLNGTVTERARVLRQIATALEEEGECTVDCPKALHSHASE